MPSLQHGPCQTGALQLFQGLGRIASLSAPIAIAMIPQNLGKAADAEHENGAAAETASVAWPEGLGNAPGLPPAGERPVAHAQLIEAFPRRPIALVKPADRGTTHRNALIIILL